MPTSESLLLTIIQPDIVWENKAANLSHYDSLISGIEGPKEIVILPEMFSTGFSMSPEALAEPMNGDTLSWMQETSKKFRIILCGSLIIAEKGCYYNRFLWVQPDGNTYFYDKRHLFAYSGEDKQYSQGQRKLIVQVKGWRICPIVCYDLRFPVWARNVPGSEYDLLLCVANWPERRRLAWKTLLQARAIENQAYCIGVNRVGMDGKDIAYSGDSSVFGPLGELLWQKVGQEIVHTISLNKASLQEARNNYPFLRDADPFTLNNAAS
ncbi:MAG: amidohydrolase [Bacteroidetes bacterium]|nr:amidohydrolase [Bacteroidota bacterium]MBS1628521.1 amidohydrolase [Bacteroidota bacterium]